MSAKILQFQPKPETTLQQHINKHVAFFVRGALTEFADSLQTARDMWRQYPELVTAPEMPPHLRDAYIETYKHDPDSVRVHFGEPVVSRKQMRKFRQEAKAWAREDHPEAV